MAMGQSPIMFTLQIGQEATQRENVDVFTHFLRIWEGLRVDIFRGSNL